MATKKLGRICLLVFWLALTMYLSLQSGTGSSSLSSWLTIRVMKFWGITVNYSQLHALIREMAHFGVHFVLAILAYRTAVLFMNKRNAIAMCLVLCGIVAIFDELAQGGIPGRVSEAIDLFLNMIGVIGGIVIGVLTTRETS